MNYIIIKDGDSMDEFQQRYLDHQDRKSKNIENFDGEYYIEYDRDYFVKLSELIYNRRSQRKFNDKNIEDLYFESIISGVRFAPSSCNRQAIYVKEIDKVFAEKYLVGGKRWIDKTNRVILLFASKDAYKNPVEIPYMPYLDAGFAAQNVYLIAESLNIGVCFVNPNIREENKESFNLLYNENGDIFCGAIAMGYYDTKSKRPPIRELGEVIK